MVGLKKKSIRLFWGQTTLIFRNTARFCSIETGGALSIRALEMFHFVGSLVMSSNCCTFASGQQSLQRSSLFSKGRMILACSPDLSNIFLRSEKWNTCNQLTSKRGMNSINPSREFSKIKLSKCSPSDFSFSTSNPFFASSSLAI